MNRPQFSLPLSHPLVQQIAKQNALPPAHPIVQRAVIDAMADHDAAEAHAEAHAASMPTTGYGPPNSLAPTIHPVYIPGTGPMPEPVSNPSPSQDGGPGQVVIPDPPIVMSGSSYKLQNGSPVLIARSYYSRPRSLVAYVGLPYYQQGPDAPFVRNFQANVNGVTQEVCVLAEITWGFAGARFYANFNVPIGQVVQMPLMAQSVDITARLILAKPTTAFPLTWNLPNWAIPQQQTGFRAPLFDIAEVVGGCADGSGTRGNAERKAWAQLPAAGLLNVYVPPFATSVRIIGSTNILFKWGVNEATLTDIPTNAGFIGSLPPGASSPVPNSANFLVVKNNGGAAETVEVAYQIGFGGDAP